MPSSLKEEDIRRHTLASAATLLMAITFTFGLVTQAGAVPITLQNGTGTFSQEGIRSPAQSVDGQFTHNPGGNGWAIFGVFVNPGTTSSQTAVWETAVDLAAGQLSFEMHFNNPLAGHLLGRFRLSVTTDDRSQFADGLNSGGDVSANWTVLTNPTVSLPSGMTFTILGDNSILTGGTIASQGIYGITHTTPISGITGVRLEALEDLSLPTNGPGHFNNGNFQLTEFTLAHAPIPEPSTMLLLGSGLAGLAAWRMRKGRA